MFKRHKTPFPNTTLFRSGVGTGAQGNPGLIPYKSKNIDLSAEWYYAPDSYVSVGWFHKDVSNFLSSTRVDTTAFGLTTPVDGPRWDAAQAALGSGATVGDIRQYIFEHFPERSEEHTSELQSLMRISYAVFCLKKKKKYKLTTNNTNNKTHYSK